MLTTLSAITFSLLQNISVCIYQGFSHKKNLGASQTLQTDTFLLKKEVHLTQNIIEHKYILYNLTNKSVHVIFMICKNALLLQLKKD